jgi:hypothetical protein
VFEANALLLLGSIYQALHNFANQFWTLVGSEDQGVEELRQTLQNELMIGQEVSTSGPTTSSALYVQRS